MCSYTDSLMEVLAELIVLSCVLLIDHHVLGFRNVSLVKPYIVYMLYMRNVLLIATLYAIQLCEQADTPIGVLGLKPPPNCKNALEVSKAQPVQPPSVPPNSLSLSRIPKLDETIKSHWKFRV